MSSVLVFGLSLPLAFVDTEAAMWFWLTLIPAHFALGPAPADSRHSEPPLRTARSCRWAGSPQR
ncbi:hypothetical protein ACFUI0_38310, partial [Streptomyces sp. NPDC057199]